MRVLVILLVFFIAVNFSVGDDSSKAKKAQNEAKAIIQKLKSQAVSKGNKLKGKINAQISKYLNEMKKVENTIYAQYKKVGVEGQIVGAIFKGNISAYLDANQKGQFMNPTAQKALADNALVNLRGIVIDPVLGDIHNLTTAINKNPANYDCFHSQKKAIQSIADNLVKQVAVRIDSDTTTLKANMTSLVAQIEALRKKVVGEVKACGKNQTCATTYFNNTNTLTYNNFTTYGKQATTFIIISTFSDVYNYAVNKSKEAVALYKKQTAIIKGCYK